mmetsp:Transcript_35988/g.85354  ORF Transcript_35988/g.85354 Transcript_35988/m.85354 type:complete len:202 (+) Transcript_35988:319-924(+)
MSFFTRGSQRFQQQMKSATAGPPLDASQYASMSELQALFRLYGPFAALELDRKSEPVLRECILSVHAVLKANQDILMRVCKRAQFPASCKKLLEEVCELRRLQPALKNLGQALFFRELCACACGAETRNNLPHVVGQIDCLDAETANSGRLRYAPPHVMFPFLMLERITSPQAWTFPPFAANVQLKRTKHQIFLCFVPLQD